MNTLTLNKLNRKKILEYIERIDFSEYQNRRNYLNYKCSQLSPYITCGIITIDDLLNTLKPNKKYKDIIFQVYWRYYFYQVWEFFGNKIFQNLKFEQKAKNKGLPSSIFKKNTGISILDNELDKLISQSHIHNHSRLWIASLITNLYSYDWIQPAKWMFYHLLDGDLASNFLSWQWVAGTSRNKKYYFNHKNLLKFSNSEQNTSIVDVSYEKIESLYLKSEQVDFKLKTNYENFDLKPFKTKQQNINLLTIFTLGSYDEDKYNILFIDKSLFDEYPISDKRIKFILKIIKDNNFNISVCYEISSLDKISANYHPSIKKYKQINFLKNNNSEFYHERFNPEKSFFYNWKNIERRYV